MDGYNICIFAYGQTGSGKKEKLNKFIFSKKFDLNKNNKLNKIYQIIIFSDIR